MSPDSHTEPAWDPQLLKGVLPMLVLALLAAEESYGYELVSRLRANGLTGINAGTVYPILGRLERDGRLQGRLVASASGPARKYYRTTASGAAELERTAGNWLALRDVVEAIIQPGRAPHVGPSAEPNKHGGKS